MGKLRIPFDFSATADVKDGVYDALVEKLTYRPEVDASESRDGKPKSAQISVQYTITEDGEYEGEVLFQNLYLTKKSIKRAIAFFEAFGESFDELVVDEETGVVLEPDLSGIAVQIKTFVDGQWGNKIDEPPVVMGKRRKAKAKPAADEDDDEDEAPRKRSRKPAVDEDDDEDEPAPIKRKRRAAEDDDDDEDDAPPKRRGGRSIR